MIFGLPLLLQAAAWAGDPVQECGKCHRAETVSQASTPMARALQRVQDSSILKNNPSLSYSEGKYSYSIRPEGDKSIYSVTAGDAPLPAPLPWAFCFVPVCPTSVFP